MNGKVRTRDVDISIRQVLMSYNHDSNHTQFSLSICLMMLLHIIHMLFYYTEMFITSTLLQRDLSTLIATMFPFIKP